MRSLEVGRGDRMATALSHGVGTDASEVGGGGKVATCLSGEHPADSPRFVARCATLLCSTSSRPV
eukprot:3926143-Prymnesium_polylepis.1